MKPNMFLMLLYFLFDVLARAATSGSRYSPVIGCRLTQSRPSYAGPAHSCNVLLLVVMVLVPPDGTFEDVQRAKYHDGRAD